MKIEIIIKIAFFNILIILKLFCKIMKIHNYVFKKTDHDLSILASEYLMSFDRK